MPDKLTPEERSKAMKAIKGKGTSLERKLWSMLAGMRLRNWRRNAPDIAGTPDAVFDKEKIAIFVDGCFWHKCPICDRSSPKTNADFWEKKFLRNIQRDEEIDRMLNNLGWEVLRIWEHEMKNPISRGSVRRRLTDLLIKRDNVQQ